MLPVDDMEFMNKFCKKIVDDTNENPETTIDGLNNLYNELDEYYSVISDSGEILKISVCQRIFEIYEWVIVTKETIQYNYHRLTIDADVIKEILSDSDHVLNLFKDIQIRQNKNIEKSGGSAYIKESELSNNYSDYSKENYENIMRLKEPIIKVGVDGLL